MIVAMSDTLRDAGAAAAVFLSLVAFALASVLFTQLSILRGRVDDHDDKMLPPLPKPEERPRPTPYPRIEPEKIPDVPTEFREFPTTGGQSRSFQFRSASDVRASTPVDSGDLHHADPEVPRPPAGASPQGGEPVIRPENRVLDYVPRLDPRNNDYRIAAIATAPARWDLSVWWAPGVTLDQGQEGSCVGHGVVDEYLASPVRGRFVRSNLPGPYYAQVGHEEAVKVYNRAKEIDEWEGVNYEGTSVRAGLMVARERGWCSGFRWAKTMDEVRQGLDEGPVVIGVDWHEQMYSTDREGMVRIGGQVVGGHCLILTGYSKKYGAHGPVFRWQNSWGPDYGLNGVGYIKPDDLKKIMFDAGGEAGIVTGRHL